jgi:hypothetical protein
MSIACTETANLDPVLTSVTPYQVSQSEDTMVTVAGRNLYRSIEVDLGGDSPASVDADFKFSIDGDPIAESSLLSVASESMEIVIPAGLDLGSHTIEVTIPDGRSASLLEAFTVADCTGTECQQVDDCGDGMCAADEDPINCAADCEWWDIAWTRRMHLDLDNGNGPEDLVDFPVLVVLDPTMIDYSVIQSGGEDLRFIANDLTTELAYEIESWNSNGPSYVWVKVPIIRSQTIDRIWMYYGNSAANSGQDPASVWSNSYASVWHLASPTPSQFQDSTGNGNNLTSSGSIGASQILDGQVSSSLNFDGGDDFLSGTPNSSLDITGDITLMAWVYPESWNTIFPRIIHYHSPSVKYVLGLVGEQAISTEERCWWAGNPTADANAITDTLPLNAWSHLAAVYNSSQSSWTLFQDGVQIATVDADDIASNTEQLSIGVRFETTGVIFHIDATLDEVRIIDGARSGSWIYAQHDVMIDGFVTYGSEEAL